MILKEELRNIILVHTARTWERIRVKQAHVEMPQDNIMSASVAIPEIANEILQTAVMQRLLKSTGDDWDWGRETKGYAYMSDCYIEQKAHEIIYNDYLL